MLKPSRGYRNRFVQYDLFNWAETKQNQHHLPYNVAYIQRHYSLPASHARVIAGLVFGEA